MITRLSRRALLKAGGTLIVSLGLPELAIAQRFAGADAGLGKSLAVAEVDGFIAIHADGSVTVYSGKVDLGQGLRVAIPQMVAEELGVGIDRIAMVAGDTALTPDQGPTAGSTGIQRGGVQIAQAAATAREALIGIAAERDGRARGELEAVGGEVRPRGGGKGHTFGQLVGGKRFQIKVDPKAPLRNPATHTVVGKPLPRPDVPGKVTGRHVYVHDFKIDGMLHARVIRPGSVGARLINIDETSIKAVPAARVVRIKEFVAVVAENEWDAHSAARMLKVSWSNPKALMGSDAVRQWLRTGPFEAEETVVKKGDAAKALGDAAKRISSEYYWPVQTHGSMGPSCAVADVRDGKATIWSASQATHRFRDTISRALEMPKEAVRVIYLDGAGCYGMNGHDDAAADAALLSRELARPVRVQWTRADEHGWDPKGPPQLLAMEGSLSADGAIDAWRTDMWIPRATANLPNVPLLGIESAGLPQTVGISVGLVSQNGNPPYAVPNQAVMVHWHKTAPLRPSNIRAPGKVANCFAVESFTDELAAAAGRDAVEFRLQGLSDPRGIEVLKRAAALIGWKTRPSGARSGLGRGMAYIHYKFNESYVAIAVEAELDRVTGAIRVHRVACAHDCGLIINPDGVKAQIEGNILQTLSRTLFEETTFDQSRVTSVDWSSYPILTFPDAPQILIDLVNRPMEPPVGAGEAAATPVPAALANAVFDASGIRLRTVPFTRRRVKEALA